MVDAASHCTRDDDPGLTRGHLCFAEKGAFLVRVDTRRNRLDFGQHIDRIFRKFKYISDFRKS